MPNNRNRNRNRNRNNRNRNKNNNQNKQQQQQEQEQKQQEQEQKGAEDAVIVREETSVTPGETEGIPELVEAAAASSPSSNCAPVVQTVEQQTKQDQEGEKHNNNNNNNEKSGNVSSVSTTTATHCDVADADNVGPSKVATEHVAIASTEANNTPTEGNEKPVASEQANLLVTESKSVASVEELINKEEGKESQKNKLKMGAKNSKDNEPGKGLKKIEPNTTDSQQKKLKMGARNSKDVELGKELSQIEADTLDEVIEPEHRTPLLQRSARVVIHKIHLEPERKPSATAEEIIEANDAVAPGPVSNSSMTGTLSPPPRYTVESPKNVADTSVADFERLVHDIQIQELSECSSGEFNSNENPPVISEVESETELPTPSDETAKPLTDEEPPANLSKTQQEELKQKRAQKRNALETHFLPQFLNPRYLDSILEENSDLGSEYSLSRSSSANTADHDAAIAKQSKLAVESFPRSQLDFTRRHKQTPKVQLAANTIREEPQAIMLETKLIDQALHAPQETCTRLASVVTPESEDAELVYLSSSASSSISDLMELELEKAAALAERALVDLDTDASALITRPADLSESSMTSSTTSSTQMADGEEESGTASRESTPVNQTSSLSSLVSTSSSVAATTPQSKTITAAMPTSPTTSTPTIAAANNEVSKLEGDLVLSAALSALADSVKHLPSTSANENFTAQNSFSLSAAYSGGQDSLSSPAGTSSSSGSVSTISTISTVTEVTEDNIENSMEKVREIVVGIERAAPVESNNNANGTSRYNSPPPPPIPPPPSSTHYDLEATPTIPQDYTAQTQMQTQASPINKNNNNNNNNTNTTSIVSTQHLFLKREESVDSHCSDSTQNSQCTAIQVASPQPSSTPLFGSQLNSPQPQQSDFDVSQTFSDATKDNSTDDALAIKKLRLLCTETLASMPYGDDVLEELATVASNIGEVRAQQAQQQTGNHAKMPYPLPDLPHINDLQLSLATTGARNAAPNAYQDSNQVTAARTVAITQLPPEQLRRDTTPPPPPVPAPPSKYDAWLGLPTNADPNVLVCLSPAQRTLINEQQPSQQNKPDQLLDAHQKFMERRGYHELTAEQVRAINNEKLEEQQILKTAAIMKQLRKSLTPPPVPPPPVPVKSSETVAKAKSASTKQDAGIGDDVSVRNANETGHNSNNNNNRHRLLEIIQHNDSNSSERKQISEPHGPKQSSADLNESFARTSSTTAKTTSSSSSSAPTAPAAPASSSYENNSRQTADDQRKPHEPPALPKRTSTTTEQVTEHRKHYTTSSRSESSSRKEEHQHKSNSMSSNNNGRFPGSAGIQMQGVESELARMFPSIGKGDIFDGERKRFSNIESSSNGGHGFLSTQPKRYSNIETRSYESKKRVENGQVVYDSSNSSHEKQEDGDKKIFEKPQLNEHEGRVVNIPITKETTVSTDETDRAAVRGSTPPPVPPPPAPEYIMRRRHANDNDDEQKIMSALKLNTTTETNNVRSTNEESERNEIFTNINKLSASEREKVAAFKKDISNTYEEFRQRAKAAAEEVTAANAGSTPATAETSNGVSVNPPRTTLSSTATTGNHFDHEKLFKDFDELSKQLHMELESGKAQREHRDKSASLFDLSRMQTGNKEYFEQMKQQRHAHMQELEKEVERSARARHERLSVPRSFDVPSGQGNPATAQGTYEIPVQVAPDYSRRAESLCNLSEARPHTSTGHYDRQQEDDWERYASDLGYSENIARPFAREVEICYQRQRQHQPHAIRAPRLSVSTNDLSTTNQHCFDAHNAYGARRTHAPMLNQAPQQQRPHFSSCYSMIERNPNPTYISTTSRRGVSPAPPAQRTVPLTPEGYTSSAPPPDYDRRQRRASLPRELHEQQLKYISSKEEELKYEFDRLQSERRRLMEEMDRASALPLPTPVPRRESNRPVAPKLPTLTEDEVFRQQMAEEWLNKVAEREERRLQKIIKISKIHEDEHAAASAKSTISDEFLDRVKERRSKLSMPADSDWESGAESQPYAQGQASESEADAVPIKVIEGKSEANLRQLPRHLREFAKFSNHETQKIDGGQREVHEEEERREEATDNSMSSATKKSSFVKTFKMSRLPPSVQHQQSISNQVLSTTVKRQQHKHHHQHQQLQQLQTSQSFDKTGATVNLSGNSTLPRQRPHDQRHHHNQFKPTYISIHKVPPVTVTLRHAKGSATSGAQRKQTRFLLTASQQQQQLLQKRRSWSESDLLQEIDNELQLAKGFLFADGVWTPKNQTPNTSLNDLDSISSFGGSCGGARQQQQRVGTPSSSGPTPPPPPTHPIWTPQPSPTYGRKEFRPVRFESPTLPRRYTAQQQHQLQHHQSQQSQLPPPWSNAQHCPTSPRSVNSCTNLSTPTTANSDYAETDCSIYAPSASVSDKIKSIVQASPRVYPHTFERSASTSDLQRPFPRRQLSDYSRPIYRPNEVIYKVKHEYMSEPETENDRPRKMAQLGRRQYDGIGPVTNDGMPIILRSEVKEPHQHEWYKRLYQTIHKQKNGARPPYKSGGYQSEPEPNYDSDYSTLRYKTYNPHRLQSVSSAVNVRTGANFNQDDSVYGTMPNPIKTNQNSYRNQPGRIEDYITGKSSVSDKEKKEWWDEVMDIFNGHLEQSKLSPHYTEGNLSRALAKESGYTSDSNLVFRKKELPISSPLSPVEQKQAYKSLQAGGEPPLLGFRKPAPEKPKDFVEEYEFIQITPTLTKIRVSTKELDSIKSEEEQPEKQTETEEDPNMFPQFTKNLPSFIPLSQQKKQQQEVPPPPPPNRKSSCTKTTVRVLSTSKAATPSTGRHEQCFQSPESLPHGANKYGTITLRKHTRRETPSICRSKSAGTVSTLLASLTATTKETRTKEGCLTRLQHQHHARLRSVSPTRRQQRLVTLRQSSRSPVAFGRSISKERTFAEEKKRLENTLPPSRTNFEASTNILRDPSLKSPQDVKAAVRSYATCNAHMHPRSKSLPRLRHASSKNATPCTSVNTTMRHTMCFPQVRPQHNVGVLDCIKRNIPKMTSSNSSTLPKTRGHKTTVKTTTTVQRSTSNESLPRSNSTFSIDSVVKQEISTTVRPSKAQATKPRTPNKTCRVTNSPLQNSKSDSHVGRKRVTSTKNQTIKSLPANTKPVTYTSKTYIHATPTTAVQDTYVDSVREKTNFWNDYNAQQSKSLTDHHQQHVPMQSTYCSLRSISPTRHELALQFSDNLYEYGLPQQPKCIEDLVWKYEHNSKPDVPLVKTAVPVTDIARPQSPQPDYEGRRFSPTREVRVPQSQRNVRSPSRRRIDSCRTQTKGDTNTSKVIRASSLSSADDRSKRGLYLCGDLAHSATSLTYLERHSPTCRYRNNSERFTDLNRFYSTLERVGQLERATSMTKFKPIRKDTELLDFDEWRKVRLHERAEKELNYLVCKLKQDQRDKDMLFRSKDIDDVKWRHETDFGLHSRDKSVEDLRENFEQINFLKDHEQHRDQVARPYWRRNTVADLASNLVTQPLSHDETNGHLSNDLVSTLSKDQIKKISQQLNEIYATNRKSSKDAPPPVVSEEYVVTVSHGAKPSQHANSLKVRCNSSITKDELLGPVLRKKEAKGALRHDDQSHTASLGKATRSASPVILGRETRGAIAAKNAELTLSKAPEVPPRPKVDSETKRKEKNVGSQPEGHQVNGVVSSLDLSREKKENITQKIQYFEEKQFDEPPKTIYHAREDSSPDEDEVMRLIEENIKIRSKDGLQQRQHKDLSNSLTNLDEIFGERHTSRVNFHLDSPPQRPPDHEEDELAQTLVSFELENASPDGSIEFYDSYYRSRSLSPQSQTSSSYLQRVYTGEVQKIKEKFESIGQEANEQRDFFGLSSLRKVRSEPEFNSSLEPGSKDTLKHDNTNTNTTNEELNEDPDGVSGDVSWITHKFELRNQCKGGSPGERSRSRQRGAISPSLLRNRLMPHIDIISKTAALKQELTKKPTAKAPSPTRSHSSNSGGIVERIRSRYESPDIQTVRYLSTSNPDLRDVHDSISPHLSGDWIAHKYPNPQQNSLSEEDDGRSAMLKVPRKPNRLTRSSSASPQRPPKSRRHQATAELTNSLRPYYDDIFANQKFDPKMHQPKSRYVPDGAENITASGVETKRVATLERLKKSMAVTFKDYDSSAPPTPPQRPIKGVTFDQYDNGSESPNRYYATDVNIHFKTPIRHEYKQNISEEELAIRQAEHMQKLYQEERRRKYLQELQDMNSRRHTDNFTPSQKSPIALNRYDDFPTDVTLKTLIGPKTVARALYNFQGQSSKELSFRKGDVIYIRRQIDPNWYEGEHNAMIGLLPVSYVEIVSRDGARPQAKRPSEGQARAKYNFQAQSGVELSLNKGELVTLTRRVDDNWFEGKIANRKGIFPVSYVEVLTDIGAEDIAARTTTVISSHSTTNLRPSLDVLRTNINNEFNTLTQNGSQPPNGILKETRHKTDALHVDTTSEPLAYRALYKYRPQNSDELELQEGDIVHVLEKCDDGWFVGTSQRTGCFGTFPGNYVERA